MPTTALRWLSERPISLCPEGYSGYGGGVSIHFLQASRLLWEGDAMESKFLSGTCAMLNMRLLEG